MCKFPSPPPLSPKCNSSSSTHHPYPHWPYCNEATSSDDRKVNPNSEGISANSHAKPMLAWKKELYWGIELEEKFLKALHDQGGCKKANRSQILKHMEANGVTGLTREQVSSHLQKHRKRCLEDTSLTCYESGQKHLQKLRLKEIKKAAGKCSAASSGHSSFVSKPAQEDCPPINNFALSSSSRFEIGQSRLLGGNTQANVHTPILGSTNPLYQPNNTGFGFGSNDIGMNLLSRGAMNGTNSVQVPDYYNNIESPSFKDFGTYGIRNPCYGTTPGNNNESIGTRNVTFSYPNSNPNYFNNNNYGGIFKINNYGELIAMGGQMRLNGDGLNDASFGFGVGPVGDSTFGTWLAPGYESSSAGFNHGNYQFPTSFSGVNEQGSTSSSTLPSMAQRQFGLGNDEQNGFMFDPTANDNNVDYVFDSIADPEQFGQFADMLNEPTDYLTSELSDLLLAENVGLENEGWDDDMDSFFNDLHSHEEKDKQTIT